MPLGSPHSSAVLLGRWDDPRMSRRGPVMFLKPLKDISEDSDRLSRPDTNNARQQLSRKPSPHPQLGRPQQSTNEIMHFLSREMQ